MQRQGLGLDGGAAALQFCRAVMQGLRELADFSDMAGVQHGRNFSQRQLRGSVTEAAEVIAQPVRQPIASNAPASKISAVTISVFFRAAWAPSVKSLSGAVTTRLQRTPIFSPKG